MTLSRCREIQNVKIVTVKYDLRNLWKEETAVCF